MFIGHHFESFYDQQTIPVQKKIAWTLKMIQELPVLSAKHFKSISNAPGLYEIRIRDGNNIFRVFCFFGGPSQLMICHGFQKKTEKTPRHEIVKARKIKREFEIAQRKK
jgi:phage-related protein